MSASVKVKAAEESLLLLPPGVVWWQRRRTLFAADLHLGDAQPSNNQARDNQASSMQPQDAQRGQGSAQRSMKPPLDEDLETLLRLTREHKAQRLVVLGDFFDAPDGISLAQIAQARAWREALGVPVWLALGDHDVGLERQRDGSPFDEIAETFSDAPFVFAHRPLDAAALAAAAGAGYRLCGHLHPVARLEQGRGKLRMRCFVRESRQLILPSFGRMTGGAPVEGGANRSRYPVTGDEVLDLRA